MVNFSAYPFLRFAFCFALGIVGYHYIGESLLVNWYFLTAAMLVYLFLAFKNSHKNQFLLALLAMFMLFGLGTKRLESFKDEKRADHLLHLTDTIKAYKVFINEAPQMKSNSLKCEVNVVSIFNGVDWLPASGLVNVYLDSESSDGLVFGDMLFIEGEPLVTSPPANPGEFDYKSYLVYNRIHHQQFVGNGFSKIGHKQVNWVQKKANELRGFCATRISELITDDYAKGVTLALVLGVKDELDDDLINAFSATGAMHVLAVSGLHVGIIYAILLMLLKRFGFSETKHRWSIACISISVLWFYALLTGLSPSVLRAVTMFTFVALGRATLRKGSIYNTLAASALVLLLYNPYLIMSVGFQLSYLAVFGIVYLQPRFYQLISTKNYLLDKVWAITCVSLAAQIATAPLSLLYFHQFPSYFLLSNLIVIPAAFVVLISGLLLLAFSAVSFLASALGWLLTKFIVLLNTLVVWVSELPGSTIEGVYMSILDTWLIYGCVIALILLVARKRFQYLWYALLMCLFFSASQFAHFSSYANTNEFSILKVSNSSVFDFRSGFDSKLIGDSLFTVNEEKQRFHLYPKRLRSGSKQRVADDRLSVQYTSLNGGSIFVFDNRVFLHLDKEVEDYEKLKMPIKVDCLILGNNVRFDLELLERYVDFKRLIIDSTNNWYIDSQLVKKSEALGINYHSIRQNGYYSEQWTSSL